VDERTPNPSVSAAIPFDSSRPRLLQSASHPPSRARIARLFSERRNEVSGTATRAERLVIALAIAAAPALAIASETVNYTYDAKGRLVKVEHNGSVNNNLVANYTHDKANNRTNLNVTGSPNPPP
jgi:hypothetical protein